VRPNDSTIGRGISQNKKGFPSPSRSHDGTVFLYAFDLIELNGDDLRRDPLEVRKATLASMLAKAHPGIWFNEHIEGDGPTVFAHACKMGLEGIVSKRKDSAYRSGRSVVGYLLANRVQLTSDGHKAYLEAVEGAFGADVDYAQLVKLYGQSPDAEKRYSPAVCIGAHKNPIERNPDPKHISTSFAERQNLNVRMHTRRFTRLTNAFSKKVENHAHAVALFALYYNFVRIHKALRTTPAMAAKVTKRLWEIGDIVDVLEAWENTT
jgi:hypothetical protein